MTNEITLKTDGLDEAIAALNEGESIEVCATLTVTSKMDGGVVADLSDVRPADQSDEIEVDDEDESPAKGAAQPGGVVIVLGSAKKA